MWTERYVNIDGIRTRYVVEGHGPPILLIHGLGEFLETWLCNVDALSKHFTVYAVDLPGHGLSEEYRNDYTFDFTVRFIVDFMGTLSIDRASLLGHSLGGALSLGLVMGFSDKVDKVVLVGAAGFIKKAPLTYRLATLPLLGDILLGPTVLVNKTSIRIGMRKQFYRMKAVPEEWVDAAYRYYKTPKTKHAIVNILRNNVNITGTHAEVILANKLHLMRQPVLIIHGEHDHVIRVKYVRLTCKLIPKVVCQIFEDCGHNPQIEKAAQFNEEVIAFLIEGGWSQSRSNKSGDTSVKVVKR